MCGDSNVCKMRQNCLYLSDCSRHSLARSCRQRHRSSDRDAIVQVVMKMVGHAFKNTRKNVATLGTADYSRKRVNVRGGDGNRTRWLGRRANQTVAYS